MVQRLRIARVTIRREAIKPSEGVLPAETVVVAHVEDHIVAADAPGIDEPQEAVGTCNVDRRATTDLVGRLNREGVGVARAKRSKNALVRLIAALKTRKGRAQTATYPWSTNAGQGAKAKS